jgi:Cu/Ag efflux pump CusA
MKQVIILYLLLISSIGYSQVDSVNLDLIPDMANPKIILDKTLRYTELY